MNFKYFNYTKHFIYLFFWTYAQHLSVKNVEIRDILGDFDSKTRIVCDSLRNLCSKLCCDAVVYDFTQFCCVSIQTGTVHTSSLLF